MHRKARGVDFDVIFEHFVLLKFMQGADDSVQQIYRICTEAYCKFELEPEGHGIPSYSIIFKVCISVVWVALYLMLNCFHVHRLCAIEYGQYQFFAGQIKFHSKLFLDEEHCSLVKVSQLVELVGRLLTQRYCVQRQRDRIELDSSKLVCDSQHSAYNQAVRLLDDKRHKTGQFVRHIELNVGHLSELATNFELKLNQLLPLYSFVELKNS